MFVAAFAGTPAVGLAASAVMWRERSLAEIADAGDLAQHPAALFNEAVVIGGGHACLHLHMDITCRHHSHTNDFSQHLKIEACTRRPKVV